MLAVEEDTPTSTSRTKAITERFVSRITPDNLLAFSKVAAVLSARSYTRPQL